MSNECPSGHHNPEGSVFCNTCGSAIEVAGLETPPAEADVTPTPPRIATRVSRSRLIRYGVLASGSVVLIAIAVVLALSISSALATAQKQADAEAAAEAEAKAEAARLELLPAAVRSCGLDSSIVQDGGRSALLDNAGNDFGSGDLSVDDLICVLNAVDTPESVINHMSKTRSLDGTQSDTWGDFSATWTYHPDHGLDIILKLT